MRCECRTVVSEPHHVWQPVPVGTLLVTCVHSKKAIGQSCTRGVLPAVARCPAGSRHGCVLKVALPLLQCSSLLCDMSYSAALAGCHPGDNLAVVTVVYRCR
jgi:hypothetical protein